MPESGPEEWIVATEGAKTLPVKELLTGRGFVSGKSGSGKSNTVSVICEELLEANFTLLIVDTEGEYFGLKEQYQLLHVGGDEFAEVQVGPEHAEKIAEISLEKNVPVILDVSGYDDTDVSEELIARVIDELYSREKRIRKPFLLIVEEMQEYLPQQGGSGELGELLERVAKRGRKRGLGMCGVSQRPSSVDKDYITQCDWMAWHKFTWESDLKVVGNVIGSDRAKEVESFDPGEAYLMTDWDDGLERVQFRRKRTFDAGATPGLESYERPDLKQVGDQFIAEIHGDAGGLQGSDGVRDPGDLGGAAGSGDGPGAGNGAQGAVEGGENGVSDADEVFEGIDAPSDVERGIDPGALDAGADSDGAGGTGGTGGATGAEGGTGDDPFEGETLQPGGAVPDLDVDLEDLEPEEIADHYEQVRRRNQVLTDEIEELREISEAVESGGEAPFAASPPDASAGTENGSTQAGDSAANDGGMNRGYGMFTGGGSGSDRAAATSRPARLDPPTKPTPPENPEEEEGLARALFEFGELMMYLWKRFVYSLRYSVYRTRKWYRDR